VLAKMKRLGTFKAVKIMKPGLYEPAMVFRA